MNSRRRYAIVALLVGVPFSSILAADNDDKKALRLVKKSLSRGDLTALDEGLRSLVRTGGGKVMRQLLSYAARIPPRDDGVYWALLGGIASFVDRSALEELGDGLASRKSSPMARDLLYALSRNHSRHAAAALGPVLRVGAADLRSLAAENLGSVRVPEAVDLLIEALKAEEAKKPPSPTLVMDSIALSLTRITGKKFGAFSVNWDGWWKKNRRRRLRGQRLRGLGEERGHTGTAVDSLEGLRRQQYLGLEKAPKKGVIVLSAEYEVEARGRSRTVDRHLDLNNDRMEEILERMKVPHDIVKRTEFLQYDLKETGAILVNCAQFHPFCICPDCIPGGVQRKRLYRCTGCDHHHRFQPTFTDAQITKIRRFVAAGGFLFCEDWVVKELLEKAFPKYVVTGENLYVGREYRRVDGKVTKLGQNVDPGVILRDGKIDVVPARGQAAHPYLRGIFSPSGDDDGYEPPRLKLDFDDDDDDFDDGDAPRGRTVVVGLKSRQKDGELVTVKHAWQIDDESYSLKVVDPRRVVPLLRSGDLRQKVGKNSLVALAFRPGSQVPPGHRTRAGVPGVVVQILSHFGKQESRTDEHTLENLLLNFLIDANVAREARGSRRKKPSR
ncbi:MAG: hypothetical protein O7J95_01305 [Planctomycetota bacterium]|nr:hypothetical protein [Planctomycetota bacterium]